MAAGGVAVEAVEVVAAEEAVVQVVALDQAASVAVVDVPQGWVDRRTRASTT